MRLQLALNVTDLDAAIDFYSRMFDTEPARLRPGYANFAIADPPLKLVLFDASRRNGDDEPSDQFVHLNHLGVEVETASEVLDAEHRLDEAGLATTGVDDTECCFAEKTETWVTSPDGAPWEWYVRRGDSEQFQNVTQGVAGSCCAD